MHHAESPATALPPPVDEPSPPSPLLLAYGTLREGVPTYLDTVLPHLATVVRQVRVPGRLYDVVHYPAAVLDTAVLDTAVLDPAMLAGPHPPAAHVICDLVTITDHDVPAALAALDHYEALGDPEPRYARVAVSLAAVGLPPHVDADGATWHTAWFYSWIAPTDELAEVRSGDWTQRAG